MSYRSRAKKNKVTNKEALPPNRKGKATSRDIEQIQLISKWADRIETYKAELCPKCKSQDIHLVGSCRYYLVPVTREGEQCGYFEPKGE